MRRPNILFICTDQQHARAMGNAGNAWVKTPHLDALAQAGTTFAKAFCAFPLCSPSRASHFTGLMPHQHGVCGNTASIPEGRLPVSLGHIFRDSGYETIWAGKWHVPDVYPQAPDGVPGFRTVPYHTGPDDETVDRLYTDEAIQYLGQAHETPFLLSLQLHNPHNICLPFHEDLPLDFAFPDDDQLPPLPANHGHQSREPDVMRELRIDEMKGYTRVHKWDDQAWQTWRDLYGHYTESGDPDAGDRLLQLKDKRWDSVDWRCYRYLYFHLVETLDVQVGRVLQALRDNGLEDNTLVLFTSDHGDGMGAHKWTRKMTLYDESVHVPMIMRWPGVIPAGVTDTSHLVSGIDILPTLCDYAGIDLPSELPGQSLKPWIEDPETRGREYVVAEVKSIPQISDTTWHGRMLRTHRHTYVLFDQGANREMLFDLEADPLETINLAADPASHATKAALRAQLRDWCRQTADDFIHSTDYAGDQ